MDNVKQLDDLHETLASTESELRDAREALARVEAELKREKAEAWELCGIVDARTEERDAALEQLAEAVGLLKEAGAYFGWVPVPSFVGDISDFLARQAQAKQQEAKSPMAKVAEGLRQKADDEWANHPSNPYRREDQSAQAVEFWTWLDLAYRDGSKGEGRNFTKYNMEVAYRAGAESARQAQGAQAGGETNIQAYQRGWDDRSALATQPAAGEPEQQTAINADDLPTKKYLLDAFDFDAPVAAGEPLTGKRLYGMYTGPSEYQHDKWRVVTDQHADWNRLADRLNVMMAAPPAAAPVAAGKPVAEMISHPKGKQLIFLVNGEVELPVGTKLYKEAPPAAAPVAAVEPVAWQQRAALKVEREAREKGRYDFEPAPPTDAHGDEAVRKDAERYRWIAANVSEAEVGRSSEYHTDWRRAWKLPLLLSQNAVAATFTFGEAIDAAMRAQTGEGGE